MSFDKINRASKTVVRSSISMFLLSLGLLSGCQSAHVGNPTPALLNEQSDINYQRLESAVAELLGTKQVLIAEDAFVDKSWIVITRRARQTIDNRNIQGLDLQQPIRIDLVKEGADCYLVSSNNPTRLKLAKVACRSL